MGDGPSKPLVETIPGSLRAVHRSASKTSDGSLKVTQLEQRLRRLVLWSCVVNFRLFLGERSLFKRPY